MKTVNKRSLMITADKPPIMDDGGPYFIDPVAFLLVCASNEQLMETVNSGNFVFVENRVVIHDEKYVEENDNFKFRLTQYAQENPGECCLSFERIPKMIYNFQLVSFQHKVSILNASKIMRMNRWSWLHRSLALMKQFIQNHSKQAQYSPEPHLDTSVAEKQENDFNLKERMSPDTGDDTGDYVTFDEEPVPLSGLPYLPDSDSDDTGDYYIVEIEDMPVPLSGFPSLPASNLPSEPESEQRLQGQGTRKAFKSKPLPDDKTNPSFGISAVFEAAGNAAVFQLSEERRVLHKELVASAAFASEQLPSFSALAWANIERRKCTNSTVFQEKTLLSGKTFSRIKSGNLHKPTLDTVMAICIGLDLGVIYGDPLLRSAGYVLSGTVSPMHIAYYAMLTTFRGFTIFECNEILAALGVPLIQSKAYYDIIGR